MDENQPEAWQLVNSKGKESSWSEIFSVDSKSNQ
jgi:hypothetical protein